MSINTVEGIGLGSRNAKGQTEDLEWKTLDGDVQGTGDLGRDAQATGSGALVPLFGFERVADGAWQRPRPLTDEPRKPAPPAT